jgi:predicted enzyme related to lactoylglutathione lyase
MERVLGVGGIFTRFHDREALSRWYRDHLGLPIDEAWWGAALPLKTDQDPGGACVVWGAFADSAYFGRDDQVFMVNFRVHDLDAMLKQLRDGGCNVLDKVEANDFGRFGWVTDPEGNRVELWQPPDAIPGA